MTIKISPEQATSRLPVADSIFADKVFRAILADEFRLQPVTVALHTSTHNFNIPAFIRRQAFGRQTLVLGAGFDKTGVIPGSDDGHYADIIRALVQELRATDVDYLEVRTTNCIPGIQDESDKVELSIAIQPSANAVWDKLSSNTRKNIRRPLKRGFTGAIGKTPALLDEFYQLYRMSLHNIGSLPHSRKFFNQLLEKCNDHINIFVGYMDNIPVVASFNFVTEHEIYGAWSGTHHAYKKHNVFLAMLWQLVEYCGATGRKTYNLGRSSAGSNPHRFKLKLANHSRKIYYYRIPVRQTHAAGSYLQEAASWLIRNTPEAVMDGLSRALIHRFY